MIAFARNQSDFLLELFESEEAALLTLIDNMRTNRLDLLAIQIDCSHYLQLCMTMISGLFAL